MTLFCVNPVSFLFPWHNLCLEHVGPVGTIWRLNEILLKNDQLKS